MKKLLLPILLLAIAAYGAVASDGKTSSDHHYHPSDPSGDPPSTGDPSSGGSGSSSTGSTGTSSTAHTWYVNGSGGTRYSANEPNGQCNGTSSAAYPGAGVNQNCAFKDVRSLWTDGSYAGSTTVGAPAWGWIGSSGDTYLIDCSNGAQCRIGQNGPNSGDYYALIGDPGESGAPIPLSGTASAHTKILGVNYASCTSSSAKAHLNGGFGVGWVFNLRGTNYVDVACLDITDFSNCGLSGQVNECSQSYPISDYADNGIVINNTTTNTTLTDVNIHGMASAGILGATGDGVTATRVSLSGNASSGWNMDDGSGTTGQGHLTLSYFTVQWNGCAEEYPIVDAVPYQDCTDDFSGGYGDGLGTATVSNNPTWVVSINNSTAADNTQDGFDFLHLQGTGSTVSFTDSLSYGNMGQQFKVGSVSSVTNNLFVGNCMELSESIPGTPSGYNSRLSDFCRAADVAILLTINDGGVPTQFINNTLYTANDIGVSMETSTSCTTSCFLQYENNIFLGFQNSAANGYPSPTGKFPTPIYWDTAPNVFLIAGSSFTNNDTFNARSNWPCPNTTWNEQNAICADPGLTDESYHLYGYGNMSPASPASVVVGNALPISGVTTDYAGDAISTTNPAIGAYQESVTSAGAAY